MMSVLMLKQHTLGAFVLLCDKCLHLVVDELSGLLAIRFVELLLAIVVADVRQLVAHAGIGYHAVGLLGDALEVVHRAGRDVSGEELFGCAAAQYSTHLIKHLLFSCDLSLFGQVPCRTQCLSAWYDSNLNQGIGILQVP